MCCFVKSLYRVCFRNVKQPTLAQFFTVRTRCEHAVFTCHAQVFTIESLHAVGVGLLVFRLLPNLDAVTGAMLTRYEHTNIFAMLQFCSCLSFIPAVLTLLSRKPAKITVILVVFDIMAIGAQSSGFWAWPMFFPEVAKEALTVPIALTLISLGRGIFMKWFTHLLCSPRLLAELRARTQRVSVYSRFGAIVKDAA
jgi:chitin synthase